MKKGRLIVAAIFLAGIVGNPLPARAATTNQISQYGITWTFDQAYEYGQFANGDYWVVGPVVITAMSPAYASGRNGWDVNPMPYSQQGYDSRASDYNAAVVPALPYTAAPGSSIVKAISPATPGASANPRCVQTAAVLTVVAAAPPNNGATVFRPPYVGTAKPYYSTNSIQWNLIPSLTPTSAVSAAMPSISSIVNRLGRVQLDHMNGRWLNSGVYNYNGVANAQINPMTSMYGYGPEVANENNDGMLRLMLNDTQAAKTPLMMAMVQGGIDRYHALINGQIWPQGSGMQQGRKVTIVFAAVMLNDSTMVPPITAPNVGFNNFFFEDNLVGKGYQGKGIFDNKAGPWQVSAGSSPNYSYYWSWTTTTQGANNGPPDPYLFIDGSMNGTQSGDAYQMCCTSLSFKGSALLGFLIPQIATVWGRPEFFDYVDRWVTHGIKSQPDPCAPLSQGGGPKSDGTCILDPDLTPGSTMTNFSCQAGKQCGRFPQYDGLNANGGSYGSSFTNAMWTAFRNAGGPPTPINGVCGSSRDSCSSGNFVDVADNATQYLWQCAGINGGSTANCSLTRPTPPNVGNGTQVNVQLDTPFEFNLTDPGTYKLTANITTIDGSFNSIYLDIDHNPGSGNGTGENDKTWDMDYPLTAAPRDAAWRGVLSTDPACQTNITQACDQYNPKTWDLAGGLHTLYLNTREGGAQLTSIKFVKVVVTPPSATHPGDANDDSHMTLNEATTYGFCWKSAPAVPLGCPAGADLNNSTRAGLLYGSTVDGVYHFDSTKTPPACWVPGP